MKDKLAKLIDVKSLVTLTLTVTFVVLSVRRDLTGEQFMAIFTTVIAFYFGTQYQKSKGDTNGK